MIKWILAGLVAVILLPMFIIAALLSGAGGAVAKACVDAQSQTVGGGTAPSSSKGNYLATSYGPPWGGIQGDGITATGINLTTGPQAYEIAVDPTVITLRSWVHVWPNPFGTHHAFYAGDTGGAIIGRHIDIYDWKGRAAQDAWGARRVNVKPAPSPGTGNLLQEITPTDPSTTTGVEEDGEEELGDDASQAGDCTGIPGGLAGPLQIVPGEQARILSDGQAAAPKGAPAAVKALIAAGNQIIDKPYPVPDVHYGSLTELWPAYDCSGSTSYVLYKAGLFPSFPDVAANFITWDEPGPGKWITIYANTAHVFLSVAGIVLNTAHYAATTPAGTGPRWQPLSTVALQYAGDAYGGFVQRHPPAY